MLTHISLASFLWDIGKQDSPRCDAAKRGVPSVALLFAYMNFIEKLDKKEKNTPDVHKKESGLIQMIRMGKSIRHKWVKWVCEERCTLIGSAIDSVKRLDGCVQ